jgi:CheY-like chemotaxis protein
MQKHKALAYYCPTTVILVDDNEAFLENATSFLAKDKALYRTFNDPKKALEFLTKEYQANDLIQQCIDQELDPNRGHRNIDISLAPIRKALYNPKRFEHVTVLVVDHDMPTMSGLELCSSLENFPIKKILLTGVASDQQAISAFNGGLIDAFINKNARDMEEKLNDKIIELSAKQLEEETSIVIDNLTYPRPGYEASCLNDKAFVDLLNKIIKENNICEYYLSEENGSYVMLDEQGKPSWLVIKDKDEMETDYFMAEDSNQRASEKVVQGLKECKLIVHMFDKEDEETPPVDWEAKGLLHPATALKGREETYYYAYIDKPDAHKLNHDKLVSFRAYQEQG